MVKVGEKTLFHGYSGREEHFTIAESAGLCDNHLKCRASRHLLAVVRPHRRLPMGTGSYSYVRKKLGYTMESRLVTRHRSDQLPGSLSTVLLVMPDRFEIESQLVDISSQGMKLSIPPTLVPLAIPRKTETVDVVFRASHVRVTCRCIYSSYNPDSSISMGVYVFDPQQQEQLRVLLEAIE